MKHSLKLVLISSSILFVSPENLPRPAGPMKRDRLRIGVHLYNDVRVPNEQVDAAEEVASRVFRQAGVELNWSDCTPSRSPSRSLFSPCCSPAQSGALVVYFVGPLKAYFRWIDPNMLATFHTHSDPYSRRPSVLDERSAKTNRSQIYVGTKDGLFLVGPDGRTTQIFRRSDWATRKKPE